MRTKRHSTGRENSRGKQRTITEQCHAAWTGNRGGISYVDLDRDVAVERVPAGLQGCVGVGIAMKRDRGRVGAEAGEENEYNRWCLIGR